MTGYPRVEYEDTYVDFTYDAVWTFAYGLRWALYDDPNKVLPLVINEAFRTKLYFYMVNFTNFTGLTFGNVYFDEVGDRTTPYSLVNIENGVAVARANWDPTTDVWTENSLVIWPDGTTNIPPDAHPIRIVYVDYGIWVAFVVLGCVAFLFPLINMILLFVWRKHTRVVASTPIFLGFILFGTMISLAVIWIISVDPTDATCIIPWWFAHTGFWIIFGCLFAKSLRVLYIFKMSEKVKARSIRPITNLELCGAVFFVLLALWVYLAIWTGVEPPVPVLNPDPSDPTATLVLSCYPKNEWIIPLYSVEFAFLLVGVVIAYQINQIDILRAEMIRFNESSHMAVCIYCLMFVGLVLVPIIHWLDVQSNDTKYVLSCCGILVATLTVNVVLFWPKWRDILTGKEDSSTESSSSAYTNSKKTSTVTVGTVN